MKTENIEKIRTLCRDANSLRTLVSRFKEAVSDPKCDKYDLKFNCDDRFQIFGCKSIHLDGYTGYYGNSGCSTFGSISGEYSSQLLIAALNIHRDSILQTMADIAQKRAFELKTEADKEIKAMQEMLNAIEGEEE